MQDSSDSNLALGCRIRKRYHLGQDEITNYGNEKKKALKEIKHRVILTTNAQV